MTSVKLSDSEFDNEDGLNLSRLERTKLRLKPDADVADLFKSFNKQFFWGKLKYVEVRWSPRMTLCAGLCVYNRRPGYCSIRLSKPLLTLRGKVDLVETLIHEMIHAYLFVTENNKDRDGHGPEFLKHMDRINKEAGLNISVYHTFSKEVRHYQQHVWLCNGPCQQRSPFFGKVHRAMNRAPSPTDLWWEEHVASCGGSFSKIAEPEGYASQKKKPVVKEKELPANKLEDIRSFFKPVNDLPSNKILNKDICLSYCDTSNTQGSEEASKPMDIVKGKGSAGMSSAVKSVEHISNDDSGKGDEAPEPIVISSEESDSDSASDSEDEGSLFDLFGSIFNMPFRFLKRRAEDPDPKNIKIRKPDVNAMPKTKHTLKNLIRLPDQPTLDTFYKKKMSSRCPKKSLAGMLEKTGRNKKSVQPSVTQYFNENVKE